MAYPYITKTLNTLTSLVNDFTLPGIKDQIKNTNYLTKKLLGNSKPIDGGDKIKQLLEYGNDRPRWMGEWDKRQYRVKEFATAAYFEWKNLFDSIVFSEKQLLVQAVGKNELMDMTLVGSKNLAKTFKAGMQDMTFKNSAAGTNEPYNMYDICVNYSAALAGIDPSDTRFAWWQARKLSLSGKAIDQISNPNDPYYIEAIMGMMFDELSSDNEKPDLIVTTKKTWRLLENLYRKSNRIISQKRVNGSFVLLDFDTAEIVADSKCPTGHMYFLNTNYLQFVHHKDFDFTPSEFREIPGEEKGFAMDVNWWGALTCSNRGYQGVITDIPESAVTIS